MVSKQTNAVEAEIEQMAGALEHNLALEMRQRAPETFSPTQRYMTAMKAFLTRPKADRDAITRGRIGEKKKVGPKEREMIERLTYLVRVGWQAGRTIKQTFRDAGIDTIYAPNAGERKQDLMVLGIVREALVAEVAAMDAVESYAQFCNRAREIISNLEMQATLIQSLWAKEDERRRLDPDYEPILKYTKEHVVIWQQIFAMEEKIIQVGLDMGVIGRKEEDRNITFVVDDLLPDAQKGLTGTLVKQEYRAAKLELTAEEQKQLADKSAAYNARVDAVVDSHNKTKERQARDKAFAIERARAAKQAKLMGGYDEDE